MPSTYSPNLRIELIASGEQGNTWGGTTNNNLGTLIENAISGTVSIDSMPSNTYTLTVLNGANDNARNMYIKVSNSTTLTAAGTIIAPAVSKMYVITNSSLGGFAITLKTSASTGISIPNGATRTVFYDGTDFVDTVTATKSLLLNADATQNLQATTKQQMDAGLTLKLSLVGGTGNTMGGQLYLQNASDPGADQCAIPRGYATSTFLPKASPTVTSGPLTLSADTPVGYQATSKNYNDSFYVAKTGSTMTGALTLYSTLPTTDWQAVPKKYVDNISVAYGSGIIITGTIAANNVTVSLLYATTSTIGGVKVDGTSITINGSGVISAATGGGGTVTGVSVATSNGFYGSSSGGATPQLTLSTTVNGILKSTGSVISPAGISAATGAEIAAAIGSATVTNATNATNASSANSAPWSGLTGTAPSNSIFSNGAGYITSGSLSSYVAKSGDTMSGQLVLSASVAGQGTTKSTNTNSTAGSYGLAGFGVGGGVYGEATGAYYTSHGVYGTSTLGYGVYGRNTLGNSFGLSGGYFTNSTSGIYSYIADNYYGVYTNGVVYAQGSTLPSDERLKENSHPLQGALYIIENLHPVSFDWKISTYRGKRQNAPVPDFGFIAQEVELVLPELVYDVETPQDNSDPNKALEEQLGTHKSMDYVKLIPFLTAAIQELNAKVEALTVEVNTLKGA